MKIIKTIVLSVFILISANAIAEEENNKINFGAIDFSEQTEEDIKNDVFFNLISVLGRDVALASIPNPSSELESKIKSGDFAFDTEIKGFDVTVIFNSLVVVATILLSALVIYKSIKGLALASGSGDFINKNGTGIIVRIILFSLLLYTPASLNPVYFIAFKTFGYVNIYANKITYHYNKNSPILQPVINLPSPISKTNFSNEILKFSSCVVDVRQDSSEEIYIDFIEVRNNEFKGSALYEKCSIEVGYKLDNSIMNNQNVSEFVSNIKDTQVKIFKSLLESEIDRAIKVSSFVKEKYFEIYGKNSESIDSYLVNGVEHYNNYNSCEIEQDVRTEGDLIAYLENQKNCISKNVVNKLTYTNEITLENTFSEDNKIQGKFQLCSGNDKRAFVKETVTENLEYLEANSINSCLEQTCSIDPSGVHSNLFACSVVADTYSKVKEREETLSGGWMNSAINAVRAYNPTDYNRGAEAPLNSLTAVYSRVGNEEAGRVYGSTDKMTSVRVEIPGDSATEGSTAVGASIVPLLESIQSYSSNQTNALSESVNKLKGAGQYGAGGFLGVKKTMTCLRHPFEIVDNFACSNPIYEIQELGYRVTNLYLKYKLYSASASTVSGSKLTAKTFKSNSARSIFGHSVATILTELVSIEFMDTDGSSLYTGDELSRDFETLGALSIIYEVERSSFGGIIEGLLSFVVFFIFVSIFLIPYTPVFIIFSVIATYIITLFSTLILLPFSIASMATIDDQKLGRMSRTAITQICFTLVLPITTAIGFFFVWLLLNKSIASFSILFDLGGVFSGTDSQTINGVIDAIVQSVVFIIYIYLILFTCLKVIEILNNNAYKFISGQLNIDDAKDRTELIARNESKVSGIANKANPFKFK